MGGRGCGGGCNCSVSSGIDWPVPGKPTGRSHNDGCCCTRRLCNCRCLQVQRATRRSTAAPEQTPAIGHRQVALFAHVDGAGAGDSVAEGAVVEIGDTEVDILGEGDVDAVDVVDVVDVAVVVDVVVNVAVNVVENSDKDVGMLLVLVVF